MENISILHYSLKLFFCGFIVFATIQSAVIYIKLPAKETRALFVISVVSFLFILSDLLNSIFTYLVVRHDTAYFFLVARELMPVFFYFLAPYYLDRVLDIKTHVKKINRIVVLAGIAIAVAIIASALMVPDLLLQHGDGGPGPVSGGMHMETKGPLTIIRDIFIFVFLIYSIIFVLMAFLQKESRFSGKYILAGLVVLGYFAFSSFYALLFVTDEMRIFNNHFPYLGLGIAILILFTSLGVLELYIDTFDQVENMTKNLRSELYYDAELEILNKISFRHDLGTGLDASAKNGDVFSLIYLDIDDFKSVNESYGEGFGDDILRLLAQRLKDDFSDAGRLYRVGADEFSFVSREIRTEDEAARFASRIITSLKNPFVVSGIPYTVTVSIAVLFLPRDGNDMTTIMGNVYTTIHNVKRAKNSYGFFSRDLLERASKKIYTVDLLRNCLSRDEFILHYQPVMDTGGRLVYVEALLRCTNNDPAIGGPGNFIPVIESMGMMKDLDNLVVRKSFYDIEMKMKRRSRVSINMSASQLVDPSYGDFLFSFAKQHGVEPGDLILEITENILVENMLLGRQSLAELKKNGFMLAIDDFGKGFSSLSYLTELPVDIIKIDKAFVDAVPGDAKKETMARYIIDLGHSLDLKVVAEGFESSGQVDFFKGLGCDFFQGYYFQPPVPLKELLEKYFPG